MWSYIWAIWNRGVTREGKLDVEIMCGQLFGSLCFDFHRHGLATLVQYSKKKNVCSKVGDLLLGGKFHHAGAVFRAAEDTTQIRGKCGSQHTGMPASPWTWFPSSALCLRYRCVRGDSLSSSSSQRTPTSRPSCSPRTISVDGLILSGGVSPSKGLERDLQA